MAVVRMRVNLVGPDVTVEAGELFPCDDATAARLVENGLAEPVEPEAPETMMINPAVERAVKPAAKARRTS